MVPVVMQVWWLAALGVVLTAARAFVEEEPTGHDPEAAMQEVCSTMYHMLIWVVYSCSLCDM